ncbi:MAG: AI-2E family transporter [Burkholderiales bacterium]
MEASADVTIEIGVNTPTSEFPEEIVADEIEPRAFDMRQSLTTVGVVILSGIAVIGALYLARAFFIPLLIGILASYTLHPVVDWLEAKHIPRPVGAALALFALLAGVTWASYALSGDAASLIEKLPEAARKVRQQVKAAQQEGPTKLQKIQEAATELQSAAADAATVKPVTVRSTAPAKALQSDSGEWLKDYIFSQTTLLFTVAAQAPIVLLLTYFLLASGAHFRRKVVQLVGPSLSRKKEVVRMLDEVDLQVQRYLLATLIANVLVAVFTWLTFAALGMDQAGVWGVTAGVLHFIPYIGPVLFALVSGMAAFMQFGTAIQAITVGGASLLVATAVGTLFMTWLQSRFASVNAAVLFIALLFFGWMWGIAGVLLGGPLIAIAKVICDRIDSLKPVGELLGK